MSRGKDRGNTRSAPEDPAKRRSCAWDRRPDESDKAYAAFRMYLELGVNERSYRAVADALGRRSVRWLKTWGGQYRWAERVSAWEDHCQDIRTHELEKAHRLDLEEVRAELLRFHRRAIKVSEKILEHCETVLSSCVGLDDEGRAVVVIPLEKVPTFARAASAVANSSIEGAGALLAIDDVLDVTSGVES